MRCQRTAYTCRIKVSLPLVAVTNIRRVELLRDKQIGIATRKSLDLHYKIGKENNTENHL